MRNNVGITFLYTLYLIFLFQAAFATGVYAAPPENLKHLIGSHDAVLVIDENDTPLFSENADKLLIPASTLKILTSLAAIHILGEDFRFQTEFYIDKQKNLIIKGYGDPLLISETMPNIVQQIAKQVAPIKDQINDIVLDPTYFQYPLDIPGAADNSVQPYDAPNGAVSVNFNTIHFKRDPKGHYQSAEPQTPLLPFVLQRVKASSLKQGRIILLTEKDEFILYAGHLFSHFLKQNGIEIKGNIRLGKTQETDTLVLKHASVFTLFDIITGMMKYSNNFIANQLLLTMGAVKYGPPGTLEKGIKAVQSFAETELNLKDLNIVEGSGLSRQNRISANMMGTILKAFQPYNFVMRQDDNEHYKTGTLKGIHTRAGYIQDKKGEMIRFVVFVNTRGKSTHEIMKSIHQLVSSY